MSQPTQTQGATRASEQEIAELMNEIAFQKVLLASIDESVQDRSNAENEVRAEIKTLEKQLRDLKRRCTTSTASKSETSLSSQQSSEATSSSSSTHKRPSNPTEEDNASGTAMDGFLNRDQWHSLTSAPSTASTPNSADSLRDLVSPSRMNLPSRKRSHSKHLDGALAPHEGNKSRRTSPSPFLTGPTTPSTSGDDEFDMFEKEFLQQQIVEEARLQREKLDADFARSMQNQRNGFSSTASAANPGPSAFDRISGVRPQPTSSYSASSSTTQAGSSSGRTLPWNPSSKPFAQTSIKSEPRSMNSGFKQELPSSSPQGFSAYASMQNSKPSVFKAEPSSSRPMPGSFRDDSSNASDSDIEIIPPSAFRDNGRHSHTTTTSQRPGSSSSVYGTSQNPTNDALQMAMYGKHSVPPPSKWMNAPSSSQSNMPSMTFPSAANGQFQGAYGPGGHYVYPSALGNSPAGSTVFSANGGNAFTGFSSGSGLQGLPGLPGLGYSVPGAYPNSYALSHQDASQSLSGSDSLADISLADLLRRANNNNYEELTEYFQKPFDANMAGQLDYIMNDPRKTNQEIKELLENIRPDADLPPEDREGTPDGLVYPLYEHQKLALTWLKSMEEGTNKGGILADDMGLGKTISALALMLSRPSTDRLRKTTLIVGPVALIRQWEREIKTKVKAAHRLSVHMMHGGGRKLGWDELRNYDVVLTSYGTLAAEFGRMEVWEAKQKERGMDYDQSPMRKLFPMLGPKSLFYRVILDEAQCIKNKVTKAARASYHIKAGYRFCLTGTPMMNNVGELYSLILFLRIKPYNEWKRFQDAFGMLTKGDSRKGDVHKAMRKLQAVLKAILLRRTKTSLIDGKPIINLPPKTEEIQHVVFSEDEQSFYHALESRTQIQFNKYLKAGTVGRNYSNILVLLLRLRQACCHPHLIHDFEDTAPAVADLSAEAMVELARSLAPEVVARLLEANGVFECPVCYDGVVNPRIVIPCGHDTCAECLSKISDQAVQQNVAEGNEGAGGSRCPSCRGSLSMNKIIDYVTFKKVHNPDPQEDGDETASEASDSDDSETESGSESDDDIDSDGDLRGFVVPDDLEETASEAESESVEGEEGDDEAEDAPKKSNKSEGKKKQRKQESDDEAEDGWKKSQNKSKGKKKQHKRSKKARGKEKEKKPKHISIAMLKKEASRSAEGRRRYMRYLKKNWQPSAKVTKCTELLEKFLQEGQKTIIFSQFVSLLDLLQVPIDEKQWKCLRYDGGMSADARNAAIVKFTENPNYNIMLISLKAGNAGLNLVAASRVIILDPFWNPFIEMQAVDRAYRIGQQRPVEVHRILIEETVEDRIIELQERKRKLVDSALDEGASKSLGRLDVQQLAFLFGVGT